MTSADGTFIVYDGECPFCSQFVRLLKLREAIGPVTLLNARNEHPIVDRVRAAGVDLDQEMALVMGGTIHAGAECINRLALMSTASGPFNAVNAWIFSSPRRAQVLYPIMRAGRNATLRLLGRSQIAAG